MPLGSVSAGSSVSVGSHSREIASFAAVVRQCPSVRTSSPSHIMHRRTLVKPLRRISLASHSTWATLSGVLMSRALRSDRMTN